MIMPIKHRPTSAPTLPKLVCPRTYAAQTAHVQPWMDASSHKLAPDTCRCETSHCSRPITALPFEPFIGRSNHPSQRVARAHRSLMAVSLVSQLITYSVILSMSQTSSSWPFITARFSPSGLKAADEQLPSQSMEPSDFPV